MLVLMLWLPLFAKYKKILFNRNGQGMKMAAIIMARRENGHHNEKFYYHDGF
jgi:hypothetical protein